MTVIFFSPNIARQENHKQSKEDHYETKSEIQCSKE
jgi:hypothetical protein